MTGPTPSVVFRREPGAFIFQGQNASRQTVLDEVRTVLVSRGLHPLDVDELLVDAPGRVVRAWWGGEQVGFVQEGHPGAVAVTVVNVHNDLRVLTPGARPAAKRAEA